MLPIVALVPLALASGGLFGFVEERFRRKRVSMQLTSKSTIDVLHPDEPNLNNEDKQDAEIIMSRGDLIQIRHSEKAARIAIGTSAVGLLWYPQMALISLPLIGYSAYHWLRTRYLFEKPWYKSPLSIVALLALVSSLATGHWLLASLVLSTDLAGRKWLAKWTEGYQLMESESDSDDEKSMVPSGFMQRMKYLLRFTLQGESRWEWFPALVARVSMGLFFAISGWNKLFTVAHWKGLLAGMIATGLPFPKLMALFLAWFEFIGGSLLTIGFMSTFFSIGLAFAMIVAIVTVEIPFVIPPGLGPLDWLDWFLYLPQVLYVLIFFWLIIKGPGPYSVDAVIAKKLGVDKDTEVPKLGYDKETNKEPNEKLDSDNEPEKGGGASWTPPPQYA